MNVQVFIVNFEKKNIEDSEKTEFFVCVTIHCSSDSLKNYIISSPQYWYFIYVFFAIQNKTIEQFQCERAQIEAKQNLL